MTAITVMEPLRVQTGTTVLEATGPTHSEPIANTDETPTIAYEGESVFLNPAAMQVGELYVFHLGGVPVVVKKLEDGSIDFYHAP